MSDRQINTLLRAADLRFFQRGIFIAQYLQMEEVILARSHPKSQKKSIALALWSEGCFLAMGDLSA